MGSLQDECDMSTCSVPCLRRASPCPAPDVLLHALRRMRSSTPCSGCTSVRPAPDALLQLVHTLLAVFGSASRARVGDLYGSKDLLNVVARNVKRGLTVSQCLAPPAALFSAFQWAHALSSDCQNHFRTTLPEENGSVHLHAGDHETSLLGGPRQGCLFRAAGSPSPVTACASACA